MAMKIPHVVGARPNFMKVAPITSTSSGQAREVGSRGVDGRNTFEPVCFVEAGFVMLAVGKGPCK